MPYILSLFLILNYSFGFSQNQVENDSDLFNKYFEYIPKNLNKTEFNSSLEKRIKTKLNSISILFMLYWKKADLNINKKELIILENHVRKLAYEINNDGIKIILKGSMAHGCTKFLKKQKGDKFIYELYFCYGDIVKNDENILKFFETFNNRMNEF